MTANTHLQYSLWVEDKIITAGQERLVENSLGLWGESGEVAEKLKKKIRDDKSITFNGDYSGVGEAESDNEILKELGDVLFYTVALANYFGGDLNTLIDMNMKKLNDREKRGKIKGSGDNR
jgi:NTP pyrophosphatase (non-canonical NTP hydrolase)